MAMANSSHAVDDGADVENMACVVAFLHGF